MESGTPSLLELQSALRAGLVSYHDGGIAVHVVGGDFVASERLDIYRNTIASVLTRALSLSYPAVQRLVGAEFFEGAARIFIEAFPPASACLDDYGEPFAEFLSGFESAASLDYLPDVARLEWAINRALHAPDAVPLDPMRLAELPESGRMRVSFAPHPSVALLRVDHPADLIWRAVLDEDDSALAAIDPSEGPAWLLVQRMPTGVEVRRMKESAWRFTAALCAGRLLAEALDDTRDFDTRELLADHLAAGRFVGFTVPGASA